MNREEAIELLKTGAISKDEFLVLTNELNSTSIENESNVDSSGELTILWKGMWMIMDAKVKIFVDNEEMFTGSFKKGFVFVHSLIKTAYDFEIKLGNLKSTSFSLEELELNKSYEIVLEYDNNWGKFNKDINIKEK